ncbi:MAG TPA: hypothetical protein VKK06_19250 [Terriglobia bacterium]|nr:hypothetical protein [Terriglobia bacterium]
MREAHEFSGNPPPVDYKLTLESFQDLLASFRDTPSPFAAADLMGVAVVLGLQAEAKELAECVLSEPITGRAAQNQAETILGRAQEPRDSDEREKIRLTKVRTTRFPRDAYAWIDQARLYTILGQYPKARRAVLIALRLAPTDRIIVRSAVRFFAHHGDWDDALFFAKEAYSKNPDPMLLGPLVSIGTQLDRIPVKVRPAAEAALKAEDRFLHSELLAAVGTLELLHGAHQRSKKFFKRAWQDPAKAVVSQSQWVLREHLPGLASEQDIDFRQSAEAMSWLRFAVLDFKGALARAHEWVLEEPYSKAAHILTASTASLLDDYTTAAKASDRGLQANPGDIILHNNLAFARLRSGDLAGALSAFEPIRAVLLEPDRIAEIATFGLLQMSSGDHAAGIAAYEMAIRRATEAREPKTALRAALNLLISTSDICHSVDMNLLRQATSQLRNSTQPDILGTAMSLARRLRRREYPEPPDEGVVIEFVQAIREGAGKLLSSLFAESVQKATGAESPESEEAGTDATRAKDL